jgi:hypothetical protein
MAILSSRSLSISRALELLAAALAAAPPRPTPPCSTLHRACTLASSCVSIERILFLGRRRGRRSACRHRALWQHAHEQAPTREDVRRTALERLETRHVRSLLRAARSHQARNAAVATARDEKTCHDHPSLPTRTRAGSTCVCARATGTDRADAEMCDALVVKEVPEEPLAHLDAVLLQGRSDVTK